MGSGLKSLYLSSALQATLAGLFFSGAVFYLPAQETELEVPSLSLLEKERELRDELEKKIQSDILEPILGRGKAMVFVSLELDVITIKQTLAQKGTGATVKAQTRSSFFGESEYLMPGIPKPKSLAQTPAEGKAQSSAQERGAEQVKLAQKTVVKKIEVVILHDEKISQENLSLVRQRIVDALRQFQIKPEQVLFKPTRFQPTPFEHLRNPNVYIPVLFAVLLMFFLLFLFGPVYGFLRGYVRMLERREGAEVNVESEFKNPQGGEQGGPGGGALGALDGELGKNAQEQSEEESVKMELFNFINEENVKRLVYLLKHEEPWIVAVVISYLKPDYAKEVMRQVLESLPLERQAQVAIETATIRQLTLEQVLAIEKDIRDRVNFVIGGIEPLVKTLEEVGPQTAEGILEYLKNEKPEVYEKVRQRLVLFEDLLTMPDKALAMVLRELKPEEIAKALQNAGPEMEQKFFSNLSSGAANLVKEEMQLVANIGEDEVLKERQKIIDTVKRLEQEGKIVFRKKPHSLALEGIDEDEMKAKERERFWRIRSGQEGAAAQSGGGQEGESAAADESQDLAPEALAQQWYEQGSALYQQGRFEEALEAFTRAAQLNPNFWEAYQYMGACSYGLGRYGEALAAYEKVLAINPSEEVKKMVESMRVQVGQSG